MLLQNEIGYRKIEKETKPFDRRGCHLTGLLYVVVSCQTNWSAFYGNPLCLYLYTFYIAGYVVCNAIYVPLYNRHTHSIRVCDNFYVCSNNFVSPFLILRHVFLCDGCHLRFSSLLLIFLFFFSHVRCCEMISEIIYYHRVMSICQIEMTKSRWMEEKWRKFSRFSVESAHNFVEETEHG